MASDFQVPSFSPRHRWTIALQVSFHRACSGKGHGHHLSHTVPACALSTRSKNDFLPRASARPHQPGKNHPHLRQGRAALQNSSRLATDVPPTQALLQTVDYLRDAGTAQKIKPDMLSAVTDKNLSSLPRLQGEGRRWQRVNPRPGTDPEKRRTFRRSPLFWRVCVHGSVAGRRAPNLSSYSCAGMATFRDQRSHEGYRCPPRFSRTISRSDVLLLALIPCR
jgi:hypothetical protein